MGRCERLVHALQEAGSRGMVRRELERVGGMQARRRLAELEDSGYVFRWDRRTKGWYRVVLVYSPPPPVVEVDEPPVDLALFDANDLADPVSPWSVAA